MSFRDAMETKEQYQEYYDKRDAKLQRLGQVIKQWKSGAGEESEEEVEAYYENVGKLRDRLSETHRKLEALKTARDTEPAIREEIDRAISELEKAIAEGGPRFQ